MEEHGFSAIALAVPFGDYGQLQLSDPAIAPFMRGLITRQFAAWFVDDERNAPGYTTPSGEPERLQVHRELTTDRLYMWLRDNAPDAERKDRRGGKDRKDRKDRKKD
jgi:hypothetical protein